LYEGNFRFYDETLNKFLENFSLNKLVEVAEEKRENLFGGELVFTREDLFFLANKEKRTQINISNVYLLYLVCHFLSRSSDHQHKYLLSKLI